MSVRKRSTLLGKVLVALKYISLILITLVCLAPIILAIVTSLKSKAEVYDLGVLQGFILKIMSQPLWTEIC